MGMKNDPRNPLIFRSLFHGEYNLVPACRNETSLRFCLSSLSNKLPLLFLLLLLLLLREDCTRKSHATNVDRDFSVGECASIVAQKFIASVGNINELNSVISECAMMLQKLQNGGCNVSWGEKRHGDFIRKRID